MLSFCGQLVARLVNNLRRTYGFMRLVVNFNIGWVQTPLFTHHQSYFSSHVLLIVQRYFLSFQVGFLHTIHIPYLN